MKIGVIGSGYVGLVTGVCLADFGMQVLCVDKNEDLVKALNEGKPTIYEPGLDIYLERNLRQNRIGFTTEIEKVIEESEVLFIAVGTPEDSEGKANLSYVYQVAKEIGVHMNHSKVIVNKSTVPIGTGEKVRGLIKDELRKRGVSYDVSIVSNPEFLREGKAILDFTHPDRVVIGTEGEIAKETMTKIYRPLFLNEVPFIFTTIETAEMIKYASNAFLATKIAFINEIANLCEQVGANVQEVAYAMGKDGRISPKFLHPGPGYGGSCFPKDTKALIEIGKAHGCKMSIVETVVQSNHNQQDRMVEKIKNYYGPLKGKTLAVLGLSFKPETDDIREAPSIHIIRQLIELGVTIKAYDPQGIHNTRAVLKEHITYCKHAYDAAEAADGLLLITEWHEFRSLDLVLLRKLMKAPVFFDFRNVYKSKELIEAGFAYIGTGVPSKHCYEVSQELIG